jgi:hypothetical protein
LAQVSCAFFGERRNVLGISSRAGIVASSTGRLPMSVPAPPVRQTAVRHRFVLLIAG